jgi:hypothetical protein
LDKHGFIRHKKSLNLRFRLLIYKEASFLLFN